MQEQYRTASQWLAKWLNLICSVFIIVSAIGIITKSHPLTLLSLMFLSSVIGTYGAISVLGMAQDEARKLKLFTGSGPLIFIFVAISAVEILIAKDLFMQLSTKAGRWDLWVMFFIILVVFKYSAAYVIPLSIRRKTK